MNEEDVSKITEKIVGAAIEVHREIGSGLLERVYQRCLAIVLEEAGLNVLQDQSIPALFRGKTIDDDGYRVDLIVEDTVIVEIESSYDDDPVRGKQLLTHLRFAEKPCGFVLNFGKSRLVDGIRRVRNDYLPRYEEPQETQETQETQGTQWDSNDE